MNTKSDEHELYYLRSNGTKIYPGHRGQGKGRPNQPRSPYVQIVCAHCGKSKRTTAYKAERYKTTYCCQECYWKSKTSQNSSYYQRRLETSPRQQLIHCLIANSAPESVVILAKGGIFTEGISDYHEPHKQLALLLQRDHHYALAKVIYFQKWADESYWPCNNSKYLELNWLVEKDGALVEVSSQRSM